MTAGGPLLELTGVTKVYDPQGAAPAEVLRGITLRVAEGESLAIVGPSGSGKSTLLNIIGTLDEPTDGKVTFEGRELSALGEAELSRFRNEKIGFVFQLHHLLPQCSALENVLVPSLVGPRREGAEQRARRLLERVGLSARFGRRPGELSGGECQRVAVVRALVNRPRLLLADEPTGSLDQAGSDSLGSLLAELNREEGVTLIVVTHAMPLARRMRRVLELMEGVLAEKSTPAIR
ncbi:MAG: ABC transporter ATP-binding protein [Lentisphaerae bacterium]|nr:ABC transporter ATP-binding protein [Lentisphaerota bacterium]